MGSRILVEVTPLPKDIRNNNRPGTARARVILIPMSAAFFDLSRSTRVEMWAEANQAALLAFLRM